jgi:excisionase family DNA binding protein
MTNSSLGRPTAQRGKYSRTQGRRTQRDRVTQMKDAPTQLDMRENTASSRQHDSRCAINVSIQQSDPRSQVVPSDKTRREQESTVNQMFELSLVESDKGTTREGENATSMSERMVADGKQLPVERPLTCEEAAALVRVHPKTVKRMARSGELPGHFRFGRWFFYASELDYWMRTELHSSRHSCR